MLSAQNMDNKSIQQLIKDRIPKKFLFEFFNSTITEDSIDAYSSLLDLNRVDEVGDPLVSVDDKYTFDLIIAILYKEVATIETLLGMMDTYTNHQDIFEKVVMLEYNLYEIVGGLTDNTGNDTVIKLVRDYVPKLYYGDTSRLSYKDLDNVMAELNKIFTVITDYDQLLPNVDTSFPTYSTYVGEVETVHKDPRFMTRINNEISYIETKVGLYSFLINYDVTNKYFIRKKEALSTGVYRKLETAGLEVQKDFSALLGITELYYSEYTTISNTSYENAHNFLLDYYEKIIDGTINY